MSDNHTPLASLTNDQATPVNVPSDTNSILSQQPPPTPSQPPPPISTGTTKEAGPSRGAPETGPDQEQTAEDTAETTVEDVKKKEARRPRRDIPDIHPDAAKAGLQVAPSATQFPTIYDVKVPVLKDDEIESNLHKNFWTGARWLAELCKYILWQAHIRLRRVGNMIVRERIPEKF